LPAGFVIGLDSDGLAWDDGFADRKIPDVSPAGSLLGFPPVPDTQFIGVRFLADDGLHYGWMRLAKSYWAPYDTNHPDWPPGLDPTGWYGNAISLPRIDTFDPGVIDWAYELTPDMPIVAGAVPEPGSMLLALLGTGISAICLQRGTTTRKGHS
jgi:hypothetical protein